MMVRVLKLVDVAHFWKVFFVDMCLGLELAHALEDSTVWLVYFHLLKLLVRLKFYETFDKYDTLYRFKEKK
jgi:hypothetical protein